MKNRPTDIHILVTGGTGSIGKLLTRALLDEGCQVSHLSRKPGNDPRVKTFLWDVPDGEIDERCIDGVDMVIHLAGAGIADKRWTDKRKKELTESRTKSIQLIYDLIKNKPNKVTSIISAAAIGYYGDRADEWMSEDCGPGTGFLPECCIAWEKAVDEGKALGLRIVKFRTGVVLGKKSGALAEMAKPVKWYAGAALGSGKQWIPWIHWQDVIDMYLRAVNNINFTGTYNMAAPHPVTNKQLMKAIASQLHKPLWPVKVPAFVFKLLLGEMSVIILASTKVSAQKIQEDGFVFKYPELSEALKQIYG
jgi:uncharacterized protein (TIGR01777 family)